MNSFNINDNIKIVKDTTGTKSKAMNKRGVIKDISVINGYNINVIETYDDIEGFGSKDLDIENGHGCVCLDEELILIK